MSDRPIQAGDLVLVWRYPKKHCGEKKRKTVSSIQLGTIFRVGVVWDSYTCSGCGQSVFQKGAQPDSGEWVQVAFECLKRIPPDALKDDIPTREGLTA